MRGVTNPHLQAAPWPCRLPPGSPCPPWLPARCTLRFPALPSPTPGTGIGGCYRIKGAWRGPAQHGPARPPGRAGKQAGPGRRQAGSTHDTSPKNAAAPDGRGGRVPGAAVHPSPGGPLVPQHSPPNTAALLGAHGLTHGPGDGGQGPRCCRGHLPSGAAGVGSQPQAAGCEPLPGAPNSTSG